MPLSRIAVVDDNASILDALQLVLNELGYEVLGFSNGRQLLGYLPCRSVDLLILDPHLPGIDGLEIVMRLDQPIPTILLTAWPHSRLVAKLEKLGTLETMIKPVTVTKLAHVVDTYLTEK